MKLSRIIFILIFLIIIPPASAVLSVTTNAADTITAGGARLNLTAAGVVGSAIIWFEYSGLNGTYVYKTSNTTITGNGDFYISVSGHPIISGKTYYFRAVGFDSGTVVYGAERNFTTSALSTITDYNFDAHFDNLTNSELEPTNLSKVASNPFRDRLGNVFWGIVYSLVFIMIWIRHEDITLPSIIGLIVGPVLWAAMPSDWTSMAMSLTVVSFAGLMYSIIHGRQ